MLISNKMSFDDFNDSEKVHFEELFIKHDGEECWEWLGATDRDGYGDFSSKLGKNKAHRVSYVIYNNTYIAKGIIIRHTCDNPSCVNPSHLISGTVQDNSDDMKQRKRQAFGERNFKAKLTENNVFEILYLYYFGNHTIVDLEKKFGITNPMISAIVSGKNWIYCYEKFMKEYDNPSKPNYYIGALAGIKNGRATMSENDVLKILKMYFLNGLAYPEISKSMKTTKGIVSAICKGQTWKTIYTRFMKEYDH